MEENRKRDLIDEDVDEKLEKRAGPRHWLPVEPEQQEGNQKVSNFDKLLQTKRKNGWHDVEDLEADGAVERVEDCGNREDVRWDDGVASELVALEKAPPDVERVMTIVSQHVRMNDRVESDDERDDSGECDDAKDALPASEDSVDFRDLWKPKGGSEDEHEQAEVEQLRDVNRRLVRWLVADWK